VIAVDTNVLVRYYVDDGPAQHRRTKRFIDDNDVFINNIVLLETFWVLDRVYGLHKETIGEIFDHLKRLANVRVENEVAFAQALMEFRENACDFADALIGKINHYYGCETATFDRQAARKLGFVLV